MAPERDIASACPSLVKNLPFLSIAKAERTATGGAMNDYDFASEGSVNVDDFATLSFTQGEATMKKGLKVRALKDGACHEPALVKGTHGKVVYAEPDPCAASAGSPQAPSPVRKEWVVSVLFDTLPSLTDHIHKEEYYCDLEEEKCP